MDITPGSDQTPLVAKKKWGTSTTVIATIIALLVSGGGVYAYEHSKATSKQDALQAEINTLQSQLAEKTSPTPVIASCQDSLKLSLSNGDGTAGTYYYRLTLTNTGTTSCDIASEPAILLPLDSSGNQLGHVITDFDAHQVTQFKVAAGGKLYATLGFPDSGNFAATQCKAMKNLQLEINHTEQTPEYLTISNIDGYYKGFTDEFCNNQLTTTSFATTPQ